MASGSRGGFLQAREVEVALEVSSVGTWEWDVVADRSRIDGTTARLFGFDPFVVARGPRIQDFYDAIHVDDIGPFRSTVREVTETGGLFVAEYRVCSPGRTRWILARGMFEVDADNKVTHGRGVVIDITDQKQDGFGEGRALFAEGHIPISAVDRVSRYAIETYEAVQLLDTEGRRVLEPMLFNVFRYLVGRSYKEDDLEGAERRKVGRRGKYDG